MSPVASPGMSLAVLLLRVVSMERRGRDRIRGEQALSLITADLDSEKTSKRKCLVLPFGRRSRMPLRNRIHITCHKCLPKCLIGGLLAERGRSAPAAVNEKCAGKIQR